MTGSKVDGTITAILSCKKNFSCTFPLNFACLRWIRSTNNNLDNNQPYQKTIKPLFIRSRHFVDQCIVGIPKNIYQFVNGCISSLTNARLAGRRRIAGQSITHCLSKVSQAAVSRRSGWGTRTTPRFTTGPDIAIKLSPHCEKM